MQSESQNGSNKQQMVRFLCLSLVAKVTPFHNSFHLLFTSINFNGETPSFPYQPIGWWFRNPKQPLRMYVRSPENNGIFHYLFLKWFSRWTLDFERTINIHPTSILPRDIGTQLDVRHQAVLVTHLSAWRKNVLNSRNFRKCLKLGDVILTSQNYDPNQRGFTYIWLNFMRL